ncbi:MAG: MFS transporter [Candidatus Omnitrophica bacterium CG11_big_fil_rev_8_21_14_0_20_42_13]|uniref:MFS transporter n=1 Tax=Candidatus Ghiorseimicrobium undicola TaxID=1974746 RepID=A0A2H0LZS7_9BACT|nr:MAG: MFS transporter [Candidatus Omnitrophica bacterium CG11_big_fil_rev_8_21_14_0_20_42_13]
MKNIAEFSVKHSLFVNLLSVFLVLAGLVSLLQLRREAFPEVSFDKVTVTTIYKGATPEEVERLVTTPLEKELKEVDDIDEMDSSSREGLSTIVLTMSPDARDKRKIVDDIQTAIDKAVDLPKDTEKPLVTEIVSKNIPVIIVSLSGNIKESELQQYAQELEDRFLDINGVALVRRRGFREREIWIEADLDKMRDLHVSFAEMRNALDQRNVGLPAGNIYAAEAVFSVKTEGEFYTKEEIENVVIRSNDAGVQLKIKDVAGVSDTFEEETIINQTEGTRSIYLVVIKKEKGDTINIVKDVKKTIEEFKLSAPKTLKLATFYDISYYIKRRLNVVQSNGLIGAILVVSVLFIFLHQVPAILTALGIPIAMLSTFFVMNLLGMSINLITMFGLVVVLGMLVDDGIIISENIYRYIEDGVAPREAAIKGASEVMAPVLCTILTTLAAFTPLMFMTGLLGKFIKGIPVVVCIALLASLIEAFIILPSHMADFVKTPKNHRESEKGKWLIRITEIYSRLLKRALKYRYQVCAVTFILFIAALITARFMPFVLFGGRGVEQFMIRAETELGTPLKKTAELIKPVEKFVESLPKEYVDTYATEIGILQEERGYDPDVNYGSHLAQVTVYLTPEQTRKKGANEIMEEYAPELAKIGGFQKLYFQKFREGPPVGKPIYARVRGDDYTVISEIVDKIKAYLSGLSGTSSIVDGYNLGYQELHVVVDEEKAAKTYLSVSDVALAVRSAFEGSVVTSIKPVRAEEEIDVRIRLKEGQRDQPDILENILVSNKYGDLITLKDVAHIEETQGVKTVRHLDGRRFVYVAGEVDNKNITSSKANALIDKKFKNISEEYPGYSIRYGGEQEETRKSLISLATAFMLAFLLIFLILATQFNSLVQPFVVMLGIPFAVIGVIIALLLHHESFGFFVMMGLVGLSGIVVNDSIVLMDFINKLRRQGKPRRESIIEAGRLRLRPVILTTITTVAGISTVAYGIGGKDPFLQPMALTVAWGLMFATMLTLIVIPCIYAIIDDITAKIQHKPPQNPS